jgi:hypothetical protein
MQFVGKRRSVEALKMDDPVSPARFVLLEHCWKGVHWDFMLEAGDRLRTWAIDAPITSDQDLPARALPDHRLIYLNYQGPISGDRGTVRKIDEGTYRTIEWAPQRVRVIVTGAQLVGEVGLYCTGFASSGSTAWIFRLGKVECRTLREGSRGT